MLGKQRKKDKVDQQFMDVAWKNMAEILDQEMPVERKERRIGWISIAALLVMGFVGGISVMWGLQKHETGPMASNYIDKTSEADILSTPIVDKVVDKNEINTNLSQQKETQTLTSNTFAYNSNTTLNNTTPTKSNNTNGTSMVAMTKAAQMPTVIAEVETVLASVDLPEKAIAKDIPAMMTLSEVSVENSTISASAIAMERVEEKNNLNLNPAAPLSELPTLGLTNLTDDTSFGIDNDIDLPKNKKWRTGIYGGAIVAGKTGNGLEAAFRVERKLGAKWAVETGLGFRATQLAVLSENQSPDELALEDGLSLEPSFVNVDGDTIASSESLRQAIANRVNADEPNYQLTLPLSFVYRPTGKLRLALGMSWAYRLNKLKDASSFDNSIPRPEFFIDNNLDQNSFSERLNDIRLNFGVGYYLNPRTAIEIAFSEGLSGSSNTTTDAMSNGSTLAKGDNDLPSRFLQIGLTHYFGK